MRIEHLEPPRDVDEWHQQLAAMRSGSAAYLPPPIELCPDLDAEIDAIASRDLEALSGSAKRVTLRRDWSEIRPRNTTSYTTSYGVTFLFEWY